MKKYSHYCLYLTTFGMGWKLPKYQSENLSSTRSTLIGHIWKKNKTNNL